MKFEIIHISERPELIPELAAWFSEKWGIAREEYESSMNSALTGSTPTPEWYAVISEGEIIGGAGVIENDFHPRRDLAPNVCAVFVEPEFRGQGIAGHILEHICSDMKGQGVDTLYLVTDHTGFYERYGWEYLCPVVSFGEDRPSRIYIHR